ncbi:uncharacterized protein LOC104892819 isoform X2 [Beta vulgaris subsp. vulgaris]|uniref:uncharacterized protein LOC104892819 isoform X2 n=1 Tax=Beta vulgaris subsp. vulgaris TaxID=3555 RepID=UPI0020368921|nr:uncharacterized protein LOC104892819 isoform X2 [Beta vulgaris subsp. vulgaris]
MEAQIWSSELATCSNYCYTEKAWHLASILLSLGRPASLIELVGRCSLFRTSPEFVEFLCAIPNSPLHLTLNNFVVLSMAAFSAFGEFVASSKPKIELRVFGGERLSHSCAEVERVYFRKRKKLGNEMIPVVKKRAVLRSVDENEREIASLSDNLRLASTCCEGVYLQAAYPGTVVNVPSSGGFHKAGKLLSTSDMVLTPSMVNASIEFLEYQLNIDDQETENKQNPSVVNDLDKCVVVEGQQDKCYASRTALDLPNYYEKIFAEFSAALEGSHHDMTTLVSRMDSHVSFCVEIDQQDKNLSVETTPIITAAQDFEHSQIPKTKVEELSEQPLMDESPLKERVKNITFGSCTEGFPSKDKLCQPNIGIIGSTHTVKEDLTNTKSTSQPGVSADPQSAHKLHKKLSPPKNVPQDELMQKQTTPSKFMQHHEVDLNHKERRGPKHRMTVAMMDKSKHIARNNASIQERCDNNTKSSKDQQKSKFPEFESYTVVEEEGSGGYGTVYRARRKSDGLTVAIKCPHENAHKNHVKNELKMLERFGGKNFVIKYEGSLKSESADCFVLEHVDHDRPEVLKREIDISQLQWYGYCMFRALGGLHRQGMFHRDIKPGNFLFTCKTNKGYLIDFNLAKDLNQKNVNIEKSHFSNVQPIQHNLSAHSKSTSPNKRKNFLGGKLSELKKGAASGSNRVLESKTTKKKTFDKLKAYEDLGRCNSLTSQGADGSGITSTRDMTSTQAPSVERLRKPQPLLCKGRKELMNFAQMQSPILEAAKAPASNRKRVAASPGITDRKFIHPTPAPLHSSGIAISGAGSLKNRGEVKPNKDGPCVGTKGFRAPEVLLRSLHQGPKIDVWSAGVTLLYLISGKMPFNGDPEQNMKDIVKLKGNEELWEVAKLHNRESSFPTELLDIRFLPSMTIKEWYFANTKRRDLLEVIPDSLFDLLEKCLTVSPRLRITADEALNHKFFAPCHDAIHNHRLKRAQHQDSKSNSLPLLCEPVRPRS